MPHPLPTALVARVCQAGLFRNPRAHVWLFARRKPSISLIRSIHNPSNPRFPLVLLQNGPQLPRRASKFVTYSLLLAFGLAAPLYLLPHLPRAPNDPYPNLPISPHKFRPFSFSKEPISASTTLYTLVPPAKPDAVQNDSIPPLPSPPNNPPAATPHPDPYTPLWHQGIWSVEIAHPQLQITRAYTPLPPLPNPSTPPALRLLIKREPQGSVSPYLSSLASTSSILVRGPTLEFEMPADVDDVLFLVGGTGIAAAMQGVECLMRRGGAGRVTVLWACRRREEGVGGGSAVGFAERVGRWFWGRGVERAEKGLVVAQLEALRARFAGRMEVECFVDEEGRFIGKRRIERVLREVDGQARGKLVMVAGSEGFVGWVSGNGDGGWGARVMQAKGRGKVGGVLGQLDLGDWRVVRL